MTGVFAGRDADAGERRLAMLALARAVPGLGATWHDLLFDADDRLAGTAAPDRALLRVLAELDAGLGDHLDTLPDRLRTQWLEQVLAIPPAGAVSDVVPLAFVADPAAAPVVVPAGTAVRAKDGRGARRRYLTTEPLTVHGAKVVAVRAYRALVDEAGSVVDTAAAGPDDGAPFAPFAVPPGPAGGAPRAGHACRFASPVLALSGRGSVQRVTVTLAGLGTGLLDAALWTHSTPAGPRPVTSAVRGPGQGQVVLTLAGPCAPDPASGDAAPWVEVALPPTGALDPAAMRAAFEDVTLTVRVEDLPVDAAYAGDAALDTEKEYQPFGPVPRRGDVFSLVSQEAFGKPLARLGVTLPQAPRPEPYGFVDLRDGENLVVRGLPEAIAAKVGMRPVVSWQRRTGSRWQQFRSAGGRPASLDEAGVGSGPGPFTEESQRGSRPGRAIRAVLTGGDLGWEAYQARLAQFAADVANRRPNASAADLTLPDAPAFTGALVTYETAPVRPERVVARDGWARRTWSGGSFAPFTVPVPVGAAQPDAATLDLGLDLPDAALGGTLSLGLEVRSAQSGAAEGTSVWQVRTPRGWVDALVADGTHGLRQSGLLRVVAPADWQRGAPECADPEGGAAQDGEPAGALRWLRLASTEPGRLGALLRVVPDAVEAVQDAAEGLVTPAEPLAAGEVKGLVVAVPGITKVVGGTGRRGREAERPGGASYARRASGLVRHRDRAALAWDYEELALAVAPEAAAVRCLPHTCERGGSRPGRVALVVVPAGPGPMPLPSVELADRIASALRPRMPLTARLSVLGPLYRPVTVTADVLLAPAVPALVGKAAVLDGLETWLHPATGTRARFGRPLFVSDVVSFLESLDVVDRVVTFALSDPAGPAPDPVVPDPARGIVASGGDHVVTVREQL